MSEHQKEHPFKNHKMPLTTRLVFSSITFTFKVLGLVSPNLAGKLALRLFMTPPKFRTPRREKALRDSAEQYFLPVRNRQISVRSWGEGPSILLSHGWAGRSSQFHAFIEALTDKGYRVVGFEIPAHGDSTGKRTNMLDVAHILSKVSEKEGPFESIIGHSFGTGTALLALDRFKVNTKKVVLISSFSNVDYIIRLFSELFSLQQSTIDAMKQIAITKFANTYETHWDWGNISPIETSKSFNGEVFLVHDEKDHEVPFDEAIPLHQSLPNAKKLITTGFGHRKILMNKDVIAETVSFISN